MRKWVTLEITVLICAILIVIPLIAEMQNSFVYKSNQAISQNDNYKTITFNLVSGQTVTGKLSYTGDTTGTWFQVYDPTGKGPITLKRTTSGNQVAFAFTADLTGEYYIAIIISTLSVQHISYDYTISSPILGLSYLSLIEITLIIAIILIVLVALAHYKIKK